MLGESGVYFATLNLLRVVLCIRNCSINTSPEAIRYIARLPIFGRTIPVRLLPRLGNAWCCGPLYGFEARPPFIRRGSAPSGYHNRSGRMADAFPPAASLRLVISRPGAVFVWPPIDPQAVVAGPTGMLGESALELGVHAPSLVEGTGSTYGIGRGGAT
jgi:hypothetical protein